MIKRKVIIFFIGLCLFFSISCISERKVIEVSYEDGWESLAILRGPIKHIKQDGFFAQEGGVNIDETKRKRVSCDYSFTHAGLKIKGVKHKQIQGFWWIKDTYIFDKRGKLIENFDDNKNGYSSNEIYKRDDKGNLREVYEYATYSYKDTDSIPWRTVYKHDKIQNEVKMYLYTPENKLLHINIDRFDEHGNIIEEAEYNSDNILTKVCYYLYDKKGNLIEEAEYFGNNLINKTTYKYDRKGNIIEEQEYFSDSELAWKYICKYDKNRNQIERLKYLSNDSLSSKHTYKYTYDKYRNWINRVEYINGKYMYLTKRTIEYYNKDDR